MKPTVFFKLFIIMVVLSKMLFLSGCHNQTIQEENNSAFHDNGLSTKNQIQFDMDLQSGFMHVKATYAKEDITGSEFLLNRGFTVAKIVCDGDEINIESSIEQVVINDGYIVNLYHLPQFEDYLHIEYTGTLNGQTGISQYVREKITPEFTFLRWETFCHPLFSNAENYMDALFNPSDLQIMINVPKDYTVVFTYEASEEKDTSEGLSFTASGSLPYYQIAASIAKYQKLELETGDYYFLENTDIHQASALVDPIMSEAHTFMNLHFGRTEFEKNFRAVEIPTGFGSFAITETNMTFVEGVTFQAASNMNHLIHEFIHTGWNARTDELWIQRARFFDEAFTSYFEYRVMTEILGENTGQNYINAFYNSNGYDLIPIQDFGIYEYGDLSYSIGALCLYQLSELVGTDVFDYATTAFLQKYKDHPVDFDLFCAAYIALCDDPELEAFFQEWIYTDAYKEYVYHTGQR